MWQQLQDQHPLQQWMQDKSTERLGWAVLISMLLHALLFGGHYVALPSFKKDYHTIEARLQLPKTIPPKPSASPPTKAPEPVAQPKPAPAPSAEASPMPTPEAMSEPLAAAPTVPDVINNPASENTQPPSSEEANQPAQPVDAGLVINPNAYRYLETYFEVSTKADGNAEGVAKIVYDLKDEKNYEITSLTEADGLAALFVGNLSQLSKGELTVSGLQPQLYEYRYGNNADKTYIANFDWPNKEIALHTKDGVKKQALEAGTQDLLSFMYQFMYVPPLDSTMQIAITNGKKLKTYDYQFVGEELLAIGLGEVNTLHIRHGAEAGEEKTELWLAPDFQHIPVKIRKTDKNGKVYEMRAKRIEQSRQVITQ